LGISRKSNRLEIQDRLRKETPVETGDKRSVGEKTEHSGVKNTKAAKNLTKRDGMPLMKGGEEDGYYVEGGGERSQRENYNLGRRRSPNGKLTDHVPL